MGEKATGEQVDIINADGSHDRTHLSSKGSVLMGRLVADDLRALEPALASCIKE
jgi:lysophospholipase L1-like esterase